MIISQDDDHPIVNVDTGPVDKPRYSTRVIRGGLYSVWIRGLYIDLQHLLY